MKLYISFYCLIYSFIYSLNVDNTQYNKLTLNLNEMYDVLRYSNNLIEPNPQSHLTLTIDSKTYKQYLKSLEISKSHIDNIVKIYEKLNDFSDFKIFIDLKNTLKEKMISIGKRSRSFSRFLHISLKDLNTNGENFEEDLHFISKSLKEEVKNLNSILSAFNKCLNLITDKIEDYYHSYNELHSSVIIEMLIEVNLKTQELSVLNHDIFTSLNGFESTKVDKSRLFALYSSLQKNTFYVSKYVSSNLRNLASMLLKHQKYSLFLILRKEIIQIMIVLSNVIFNPTECFDYINVNIQEILGESTIINPINDLYSDDIDINPSILNIIPIEIYSILSNCYIDISSFDFVKSKNLIFETSTDNIIGHKNFMDFILLRNEIEEKELAKISTINWQTIISRIPQLSLIYQFGLKKIISETSFNVTKKNKSNIQRNIDCLKNIPEKNCDNILKNPTIDISVKELFLKNECKRYLETIKVIQLDNEKIFDEKINCFINPYIFYKPKFSMNFLGKTFRNLKSKPYLIIIEYYKKIKNEIEEMTKADLITESNYQEKTEHYNTLIDNYNQLSNIFGNSPIL